MNLAAFLDRYPSFAGVPTSAIETQLGDAALFVTAEYGTDQERATALLVAHRLSLAGHGPEAASGAFVGIKSINSGSLSFTKDDKLGDWGLTTFGREFYPIWRSVRAGPLVTGAGNFVDPNYVYAWHGRNA